LETIGTSTAQSAAAVVQIAESALGEIEEKAVFLEFGTSKMPAEPSFRPGFEEAKDRAAEILIERIAGVINK
jgi:HK97 gp10 family phage protein